MFDIVTVSQVLLLATGVALIGLAFRTYRTHTKPVGVSFSVLIALLGGTAVCLSVTAGIGTANKLIWLVTNLSIPVALLAFGLNYYGLSLFAFRTRIVAVLTPVLAGLIGGTLVIVGTPAKTPGAEAPFEAVAALPGVVFSVATTFDRIGLYYTAGLVIVAVGIVALNVFRYEHLDTRLATTVAFIGAWPWLGNALVPDLTALYGDAVSLAVLSGGYMTSAVVAGLVVGPFGLLDSSPAAGNVGSERVLDSMSDAVLITDDQGRILRLNHLACEWFDTTESTAVGQPLSTVVGRSPDALTDGETTPVETAAGVRQCSVTKSTVVAGNVERGTVFVLRDVTQRQTRKQRLEVLNRVLRHNLRNEANTIIARAEILKTGQQNSEAAAKIVETTQELVGVAETARDIETMMEVDGATDPVDISRIVDDVVSQTTADYPAAEVSTSVPSAATAPVSPEALETVLFNLADNAVEHNDSEQPLVVISVDDSETDTVRIAVSDNGPGIPDHELAVLEAGGEDKLEHGSGLGLWAVNWGITQMGGTFSVSDNEPRGTTVTVSLPAATTTASATEDGTETVATTAAD